MQLARRDDPDVPRARCWLLLPRQRFFAGRSAQSGPADTRIAPELRRLLATAGQWRHHTASIAGLRSRTRKMGAPRLNCIGSAWCWRPPIAITPRPSPVDIPADIARGHRLLPCVSAPNSLKVGVAASVSVAPRARRSKFKTKRQDNGDNAALTFAGIISDSYALRIGSPFSPSTMALVRWQV